MNNAELKTKLSKPLDFLKSEINQIRTGRASPSILEEISVDAYGAKMSVREVGSITVLDSQNLVVAPWDKSLLKSIAKSIRESNLNLNPVEESDRIRVPIPALTEDRRKDLTKLVSTKVEEAKNAIRNIRHDEMKDIDADFEAKNIGEDDKFKQKEEVEKVVKTFIEQADEIGEAKKQELMTI